MKIKHLNFSRLYIGLINFIQKFFPLFLIAIILFLIGLGSAKGLSLLRRYNLEPTDLFNFFREPKEKLDTTNNVTNFLLLGIRGQGSDSPDLSDTIIVLSYNHTKQQASLISIPRDLWVPSMQAKINTAYHYGEEASPGAGISLSQASILEITGFPVHYTAVVDFALFKDVIDLLGGIDIQNEIAFTDTEFPIPGKENAYPVTSRYETISFPAGAIHLDGETALKYVRSRHSEGDSGTDYDRSRRQQATLSGIKEKLLTKEFLLDTNKTGQLFDLINKNLITNLQPSLYPTLAKLAFNLRGKPINSIGLSDHPDSNGITVLYHPSTYLYKGEWVLIPKQNNWNALKQYINNKINSTQ